MPYIKDILALLSYNCMGAIDKSWLRVYNKPIKFFLVAHRCLTAEGRRETNISKSHAHQAQEGDYGKQR